MANASGMATRASKRNKITSGIPTAPTVAKTTRTRTTTKAPANATEPPTATKHTTARKPLKARENSVIVSDGSSNSMVKAVPVRKTTKLATQSSDHEPITAYLRIRPHLGNEELILAPYLIPLSATTVQMTDPQENQGNRARFRPSAVPPSSLYTFSHVFPPETTQSDFFSKTTLPLVRDVLQGQNGLLFAYGVTNSGKTYTVQGGDKHGSAGILPRTLDVIFNSIEGLQGDIKYRPVRLYGIEPSDPNDADLPQPSTESALGEVLGQLDSNADTNLDIDPTAITVDRNYEYSVWISYVEVYNEKLYDLLDSIKDEPSHKQQKAATERSLRLTRKALPLRSSPASDNGDTEINGKYIAGLRQFRVSNAAQAKSIVKLGQLHRRVFGTLANRESSRSHSMVITKIVRGHRGEKDNPTSLQVSRLTLVDLAGSERTKHTHTTGERLKEAGNINKSLMVLGQCMEAMRSNQRKLATSLGQDGEGKDGRVDTRDVRKTFTVVPFRHSKLTETLMDYFTGEGRVVMIVNANPYDTGYDENSHVMKFSALAREVCLANGPAPVHKIGPGKLRGQKFKDLNPLTMNDPEVNPNPFRRKVTISMGTGKKISQAILEVVEEDEPTDETDGDDEPLNPLIDALFNEVENLRMQLFEAEMKCALIEADTREEVMREMEERMRMMEEKYSRRLMNELEQNELKTDAKIDMLHKAGLFGSPIKQRQLGTQTFSEEDEEEDVADVEMSLMVPNEDYSEEDSSQFLEDEMLISPLAEKPVAKAYGTLTQSNIFQKGAVRKIASKSKPLPSQEDTEMDHETEAGEDGKEEVENNFLDLEAEEVNEDEDGGRYFDDEEEYSDEDDDPDEEWKPPKKASSKGTRLSNSEKTAPSKQSNQPRVSKLECEMKTLTIEDNSAEDPNESIIVLPAKSRKVKKIIIDSDSEDEQRLSGDSKEEDIASTPVVKKKKRQLGKKPIMTADNIERVTWEVEKRVAKTQGNHTIRRLTGN